MKSHRDQNQYSQAQSQSFKKGQSSFQNQFSQNQENQNFVNLIQNASKSKIIGASPSVNSFNFSRHLLNQPTPQAQYASIHAQQSVRMDLSNSKILVQSCNQFLHSNQGENQIERGNHIEQPTKKICIGKSKLNPCAMITMNEVKNRILFLSPVVQDYLESEQCIEDFSRVDGLYEGNFCQVVKYQHKLTQKVFAIKRIQKQINNECDNREYIINEAEILYRLNHPNIIKLLNHFEDDSYVYFVFDFYSNGTLRDLRDEYEIIEVDAAMYIKQIAKALDYIHRLGIIHRDLKPQNILIDDYDNIKICDFGLSVYSQGKPRQSNCGTPLYMAPEVHHVNGGYNNKCDIFSLGMILFYLLTDKEHYWPDNNINEEFIVNQYKDSSYQLIIKKQLEGYHNVSPDGKKMVLDMLQWDANKRPSADNILKSLWQLLQRQIDGYVHKDCGTQELELLETQEKRIYTSNQMRAFMIKQK